MKSFFGYDGPVIVFFSKMADLIVLNILTIVFCIPVITIGASFTACYYTALKIQRGEGYVLKNFWKSFKDNIVKSTVIFCVFVVMGIIMLLILKVLSTNESGIMSAYLHGIYFVLTFGYLATLTWVFPIQSRFENSILTTIMKAFIMSCRYLFRTIVMMIMWIISLKTIRKQCLNVMN